MPLSATTTNTPELDLVIVVDKIDSNGELIVPKLRWNRISEEFSDPDEFGDHAEAFVSMTEDTLIAGLYTAVIEDIDGATELLRITIINNEDEVGIGVFNSIPVETFVTPEVIIDLTVTEDRN
jgi:hypothetical protein